MKRRSFSSPTEPWLVWAGALGQPSHNPGLPHGRFSKSARSL